MALKDFPKGGKNMTKEEVVGVVGELRPVSEEGSEDGFVLFLLEDRQKMHCFLTFKIYNADNLNVSAATIPNFLQHSGIRVDLLDENVKYALTLVQRNDQRGYYYLVAAGKPARRGQDGRIEWYNNYPDLGKVCMKSGVREQGEIQDGDPADYRNVINLINVREGAKILTVHPPTLGIAGVDIYGNELGADPGREVAVRPGKNVTSNMEQTEFFAALDGRVVFQHGVVAVDPRFEVQNDLDLSVGNIDFVGEVICYRNVPDNFSIRAEKGVEIRGVVEATNLECETNITLAGGMNGKERAYVRARGNLYAKYLNGVSDVEVSGDVVVRNSVIGSSVYTNGKLTVEHEGVVGGEISALHGLDVPVIGSELGVKTRIVVGADYQIVKEIERLMREIAGLDEEIEKINSAVAPMLSQKGSLAVLPEGKKIVVRKLLEKVKNAYSGKTPLLAKLDELDGQRYRGGEEPHVIVRKRIYPGTSIYIKDCHRIFEEGVPGPVMIVRDTKNMTLRADNLNG